MTTSTRATFGPGGQRNESVRQSQSLRARALAQQAARLERSQARRERDRANAQNTSFYAGGGEYRTLGAAGAYRPAGTVTSGGVPVGQRVPANGGLVGGMPAAPTDDAGLRALAERVAGVAQERGWQTGVVAPTAEANPPRYPTDIYLDTVAPALYYWVASTGSTPGVWEMLNLGGGAAITYGEGDPNLAELPSTPGEFYYDTLAGRLFVAVPAPIDPESPFPATVQWAITGNKTFDTGTYNRAEAVYVGDAYQANDGAIYILSEAGTWRLQYFCPECPEEPEDPPCEPFFVPGYIPAGTFDNPITLWSGAWAPC